ncbi:MAG TPA: hypothetical protein VMD30_08275 [Tepidisphaeraceae bacterium]|nr:hypothetical protein [Tepidisphaeraceae bacterium]
MPVLRWRRIFLAGIILGLTAGITAFIINTHLRPSAPPMPVKLISLPQTRPVHHAAARPVVATYMDVVRGAYPNFPATQPFDIPAELPQAGHLIVSDPIYVGPRGDLWITDPNGPPIEQVLPKADADTEHVTSERISYMHWNDDLPTAIIPRAGGGWDIVDLLDRRHLPWRRPYHWGAAMSWGDQIIVPTDCGVSILNVGRILSEDYQPLIDAPCSMEPQISFDGRGILAWVPPDPSSSHPDSGHIARYVDDHWTVLSGNGWVDRPVHLVPLLDGSVLQFVRHANGTLKIEPVTLEAAPVDADKIDDLIDQLGDDDPDKRAFAYAALSQYGPGIWQELEAHANDPSLDVSMRIRALLLGKTKPLLGGMSLVTDDLVLANRFPAGGVILYSAAGVIDPFGGADDEAVTVKPAWICLAPGQPAALLPPGMTQGLWPTQTELLNFNGEWIAEDDAGPRRFLSPSTFVPLLRGSERPFSQLIAIDRRGRWLFRRPGTGTPTLIIDPNLPDPQPRLLVWIPDPTGAAGWDKGGWPVMAHEDKSWLLKDTDWFPVDLIHDRVFTQAPPNPAAGGALLRDSHGNLWYDGMTRLVRLTPSGKRLQWALPPEAAAAPGTLPSEIHLVETSSGLLYLFNASGRVLRIRATPDASAPLHVEGVFKNGIPESDQIVRVWLDPADRIDIVYKFMDRSRLAVLFADGDIPPELQRWIMPRNLRINGPQ